MKERRREGAAHNELEMSKANAYLARRAARIF